LPAAAGAWATFPALKDLFIYDGSGVMPGRTWIIAPDVESLKARWLRLAAEKNPDKKELLFHPHIRKDGRFSPLAWHHDEPRSLPAGFVHHVLGLLAQ
jgi:hypothetical protein